VTKRDGQLERARFAVACAHLRRRLRSGGGCDDPVANRAESSLCTRDGARSHHQGHAACAVSDRSGIAQSMRVRAFGGHMHSPAVRAPSGRWTRRPRRRACREQPPVRMRWSEIASSVGTQPVQSLTGWGSARSVQVCVFRGHTRSPAPPTLHERWMRRSCHFVSREQLPVRARCERDRIIRGQHGTYSHRTPSP
jgi:hypothetical protein